MAEALHNINREDIDAASISSSDNSDECEEVELVEELVQDVIGSKHEMVLVPVSKSLNAASSSSMQTGEAQREVEAQKQYYCETFLLCIQTLKQEQLIKRSPKGKRIMVILDAMERLVVEKKFEICVAELVQTMDRCLIRASQIHHLPAAVQCTIWSEFHSTRCSLETKRIWETLICKIPEAQSQEHQFTMQILLDRILKRLIKSKAQKKLDGLSSALANVQTQPLTMLESNAIRYMAGYVAVSLLRRYRKPSKNIKLQEKRSFFVKVLSRMKCTNQPGEPTTTYEYSKLWSELIDRGGLYHINDKVNNYDCVLYPCHAVSHFDPILFLRRCFCV